MRVALDQLLLGPLHLHSACSTVTQRIVGVLFVRAVALIEVVVAVGVGVVARPSACEGIGLGLDLPARNIRISGQGKQYLPQSTLMLGSSIEKLWSLPMAISLVAIMEGSSQMISSTISQTMGSQLTMCSSGSMMGLTTNPFFRPWVFCWSALLTPSILLCPEGLRICSFRCSSRSLPLKVQPQITQKTLFSTIFVSVKKLAYSQSKFMFRSCWG